MDATPQPDATTPSDSIIPSLLEYVFAKVRAASDAHRMRQDALDAQVDYSWMCKFATGKIPGASYLKIHALAEFYFRRDCEEATAAGHELPASPFLPVSSPSSIAPPPSA